MKRIEDEEAQQRREIYCVYPPRCSMLPPWLETEEGDKKERERRGESEGVKERKRDRVRVYVYIRVYYVTAEDLSNIFHFSDAQPTPASKLLAEISTLLLLLRGV